MTQFSGISVKRLLLTSALFALVGNFSLFSGVHSPLRLFEVESTAWADGTGIELPPLDTDEDKLKFLIWIKERIPALFSDAAQYEIDLMTILDDQKRLVDLLKKYPEYEKAFKNRKYVQLTVTPPPEGIEVNQVKLKPGVVDQWREKLKTTLDEWSSQNAPQKASITDGLLADIQNALESESKENENKNKAGQVTGKLFSTLSQIDGIKARFGKEPYGYTQKASLLEKLGLMEKILKEHPGVSISADLKQQLDELLRSERNKKPAFKSKDLTELYLALQHAEKNHPPSHQLKDAHQALNRLSEDDLQYFSDQNDVLSPSVNLITQDQKKRTVLLNGIFSNIQNFSKQTEGNVIKATEPVILKEVTPREAIFRGCTGGDCSSQYSFPYPNDPQERVFFISDKNGKLKGYVSATEVESNGTTSLYVITISGKRVNAGDTELVLRGLDQAKEKLGVHQIILPEEKNIDGLINFPEVKGVYVQHAQAKKTVPITYLGQELRQKIEQFPSKNNTGSYDYMVRNQAGVIFSENTKTHSKLADKKVDVKTEKVDLPNEPFKNLHLTKGGALEFALDMHHSERLDIVKKVIDLPAVNITEAKFEKFINTIENKDKKTVKDYSDDLDKISKKWNINLAEKKYLIEKGLIQASDAFDEAYLEKTAKIILKNIDSDDHWSCADLCKQHSAQLNKTNSYKAYLNKLENQLDSEDNKIKLTVFGRAQKAGVYLDNKFLKKGLSNETERVRLDAANMLYGRKDSDNSSLFLLALSDKSDFVRKAAANGILYCSGPDTFSALMQGFKDKDTGIRKKVAQALPVYKGPDASTLYRLGFSDKDSDVQSATIWSIRFWEGHDAFTLFDLGFSDENPDVRKSTADILAYYSRPNASSIFKLALSSKYPEVRIAAVEALASYEGSDASSLLQAALSSQDPEIRKAAAKALRTYKGPDASSFIKLALSDQDFEVQMTATEALGSYKGSDASSLLQAALSSKSPKIRIAVAKGLGSYEGPDTSSLFKQAFSDQDPEVRKAAGTALRTYKGPDASFIFKQAFSDQDPEVRKAAGTALRTYKSPDAFSIFKQAFSDQDPGVRKAVAEVLRSYVGPDASSIFKLAFSDQDPEVLRSVAESFVYFNAYNQDLDVSSVYKLVFSSEDESGRAMLANVVQNSSHYIKPIVLSNLVKLLKDDDIQIRKKVILFIKENYSDSKISTKLAHLKGYLDKDNCALPIHEVLSVQDLSDVLKYLKENINYW